MPPGRVVVTGGVGTSPLVETACIRAGQKSARFAGAEALPPWLVYGGEESYARSGVRVIGWRELARADFQAAPS